MHLPVLNMVLAAMFFTTILAIPQIIQVGDVAVTGRSISDTFDCPVKESSDGRLYVLPCTGKVIEKRALPSDFVVYPDSTGHYLGRSLTSDQVARVVAGAPVNSDLQKRQSWIAGLICLGDLYVCEEVSYLADQRLIS